MVLFRLRTVVLKENNLSHFNENTHWRMRQPINCEQKFSVLQVLKKMKHVITNML